MKKFSKVKYFGAVAAALLAVAPIAAPVVSQVASPAIVEAATPGAEAIAPQQADEIQGQLNTDVPSAVSYTNAVATSKLANIQQWITNHPQNITSAGQMPDATEFLSRGNPFITAVPLAASLAKYSPTGQNKDTTNTFFSYTVTGGYGNQLTENSQTQQINSNLQLATIAQGASTYTFTVTAYDSRSQKVLVGTDGKAITRSVKVTIAGKTATQATATGTFTPVTVNAGDAVPGLFADPTYAANAITLKVNGQNITLNAAQDIASLGYNIYQPTQLSDVTRSMAHTNIYTALANYIDKSSDTYTGNGVAYQVAQLSANNNQVQGLRTTLAGTDSGLLGGDLWWDKATKNLYLVRPITVRDTDYNAALPQVFYQYQSNGQPTQYWEGSTVYLTTADDASLNKTGKLTTVGSAVTALAKVLDGKTFKAQQSASNKNGAYRAKNDKLTDAVISAATKAGVNFVKSGASSSADWKFDKTSAVDIPVTFFNDANLTTTVNVPVTLDGVAQDSPLFTFAQGWVQNPTVQVGSQFKATEGITAWANANQTTQIDPVNWKIDGSVDTSKPGKYDLTYTITNPTSGKTAQLKRTVTVTASDKTQFEDVDSVVYVQTSKTPQYSYDAKTDKFTKNDDVKALPLSSGWKTSKKATAPDGSVYYIVGGNGWLKASDVTTAKVTKTAGVVTVTKDNGTYTTANTTSNSGNVKYLANNTGWKYFALAVNPDGTRAYLVADNQWVSASDVVERVNSASGTFTVGSDAAPVFNGSGSVIKGTTLKARSSWKVTGVKNINGKPYYRVSTDGYVRADYGSYKA
ncbi:immunoglobulin-like domain-containing protein [Schleiferilactobacillus shenzhenensis]|uniref:DUF5011 domain-containing protein n=1 Tax=Schleiferilactobacillus shenzhenensis LY-73 TaxID=1231336 RepID=U4TIN8_9LACO|nr:immunoglobulin-like domain-containing protein [Schleiferilactobacillus shenzhenensis]ERL64681.1 hypothetical protein L248_0738 [Schleiferilactobacillus shenzhenensis LY-73]